MDDAAPWRKVTRSPRELRREAEALRLLGPGIVIPSLIVMGGQVSSGKTCSWASSDVRFTAGPPLWQHGTCPLGAVGGTKGHEGGLRTSPLGDRAGLLGAAFLVVDQLFARECLARWIQHGSPSGRPELAIRVAT